MADISAIKLPDGTTYNLKDTTARQTAEHALPKTGGTMSGQILTSFKHSVAIGSYQPDANTIPDLVQELRYSSGCMGSTNITTAYNSIPTGWYNFIYIPHRSGGVNGAAHDDNCDYGSLILIGMTETNQAWIVEFQVGSIASYFSIRNTDTTYGLASTTSNGLMSATDKKAVDREFFRMLPKGGTYIPPNADLNTIQYLKVGNYYNSLNVETATMKNCPSSNAFMMYVLSPLSEVYDNESTAAWVYRLRILIDLSGYQMFFQNASSGNTIGSFSYGPWVKIINSDDLVVATQSSPGLMSAADKTKLDNLSSASTEGKEGVELTIPVSGWSSNTTAVNGTDYYTYSTTSITGISNPHPTIVCSSASGVLPSAEEKMAFDNIYFVTVDTSSSKITFYAPTKPNSTVVLIVKDFTAESTSSASANLTIATSDWSSSTTNINGAKYYTAKKTVSGINQAHPPVICHTASSSAALPSKAEQTAYNCIDYTTVDTSTNTITFYAMTKPSAAIALTMV